MVSGCGECVVTTLQVVSVTRIYVVKGQQLWCVFMCDYKAVGI